MNAIGNTYAIGEGINNHAHLITITKPKEAGIPISDSSVFHHRFADVTQIWKPKFDQEKMANMENKKIKPKNTHTTY